MAEEDQRAAREADVARGDRREAERGEGSNDSRHEQMDGRICSEGIRFLIACAGTRGGGNFITRALSRDGTPQKSRKVRTTPGHVLQGRSSRKSCKQDELKRYDRLDRTQEVAGSSP